jgi:hypothetical protein
MARGNFVEVTYRHPQGIKTHEVVAEHAGGDVAVAMPDRNGLFVTVDEINKVGDTVRTARFLATEVLSIVEGSKPPQKMTRSRK